jgi:hypothetical protein
MKRSLLHVVGALEFETCLVCGGILNIYKVSLSKINDLTLM